jgi:hypothetical protein
MVTLPIVLRPPRRPFGLPAAADAFDVLAGQFAAAEGPELAERDSGQRREGADVVGACHDAS